MTGHHDGIAESEQPQRGSLPVRALAFYVLAYWPTDTLCRNDIRSLLPTGDRKKMGRRTRNTVTEALRDAVRLADRAGFLHRARDVITVRDRPELLEWALILSQADERQHPQLVATRQALGVSR